MFIQVYYQEIYPITIIRDIVNPLQCWFRASDIASLPTFIPPKFVAIGLIYQYSFVFKEYTLLLDTNAPDSNKNGSDIYLDLNGIALFFLLARCPNWDFFAWAKGMEEPGSNIRSELSQLINKGSKNYECNNK